MTRYISFINSLGAEYVFSRIISLSGFDVGESEIISAASSGQDGSTYKGTMLRTRMLKVQFDIVAKDRNELMSGRRAMINLLSPKYGQGRIRYSMPGFDVSIPCTPASIACAEHGSKILSVLARFDACNPYFADTYDTTLDLSFYSGALRFPLYFPCAFGDRSNVGTVQNTGDAPVPVVIRLHGGAQNPQFVNHTTGERIVVYGDISAESILEINTAPGVKSVKLITGEVETSAFPMLDPASVLWELPIGASRIEYNASSDNIGTRGEIVYKNCYVGV